MVLPVMLHPGPVLVAVIRDIQAYFVTKVIVILFLACFSKLNNAPVLFLFESY